MSEQPQVTTAGEHVERLQRDIGELTDAARTLVDAIEHDRTRVALSMRTVDAVARVRTVTDRLHQRPPVLLSVKEQKTKPTQTDWLIQWARDHDGIIKVSEARRAFLAAGLTDAKPRNVYSNIVGMLSRSGEFEQVDVGIFRRIVTP